MPYLRGTTLAIAAVLLIAPPAHAGEHPGDFLSPGGFEMLDTSLETIARAHGIGWPQSSGSRLPGNDPWLCYHLPEAESRIIFQFDAPATASEMYNRFVMQKAPGKESHDECETLRRSQVKDFLIGGIRIGQDFSSALDALHGRAKGHLSGNCREFTWEVPWDSVDPKFRSLADGNPVEPPTFTRHLRVCITAGSDNTVEALEIAADQHVTSWQE